MRFRVVFHSFVVVSTLLAAITLHAAASFTSAPANFEGAKVDARQYIYHDRIASGTFYCGCQWRWVGRSGGRVDWESCGYQVRAQQTRAERTEWEHIVPASNFGKARQCWQQGGRKNCTRTDPVFQAMEADLHNLTPVVGEVNGDRSNYNFGMLPATAHQHGACPVKVDFKQRTVEPRDAVKGQIARIYFYMHDRYDLPMSRQQQQLLITWNEQFPVSGWERQRDRRIAGRVGHGNPFVTGERRWSLGHKNTRDGLVSRLTTASAPSPTAARGKPSTPVRGNRSSKIYHLAQGCPSYGRVNERNRIVFRSAADAEAAGFRKAGNCR